MPPCGHRFSDHKRYWLSCLTGIAAAPLDGGAPKEYGQVRMVRMMAVGEGKPAGGEYCGKDKIDIPALYKPLGAIPLN